MGKGRPLHFKVGINYTVNNAVINSHNITGANAFAGLFYVLCASTPTIYYFSFYILYNPYYRNDVFYETRQTFLHLNPAIIFICFIQIDNIENSQAMCILLVVQ